jgi:hypothetical protein
MLSAVSPPRAPSPVSSAPCRETSQPMVLARQGPSLVLADRAGREILPANRRTPSVGWPSISRSDQVGGDDTANCQPVKSLASA